MTTLTRAPLKRYTLDEMLALTEGMSFQGAADSGGYMVNADVIRTVSGTSVTVDGQPLSDIWTELNARLNSYNRHMDFMTSLFSFPVFRAQSRVGVYETPKFARATEFGRPSKIRLKYVFRGYPLEHRDLAYGFTQEFIDSSTGRELLVIGAQAENAWSQLRMSTVLEALFTNTNATDIEGVSVKRLYNNDGEIPPPYKRFTHLGTHQHYLTSAAVDLTAIGVMEEHLIHHGFGDNGETLVLMANRTDAATIRGLTGYVPAVSANRPVVLAGPVVGAQRSAPAGLTVEGYIGLFAVVESLDIPSGYLLGFATGGSFAQTNPVGLRQHENPSARGLRLIEGGNTRYPLTDSVYDGYLGAGVAQRGAGVITQITGGAYTAPTF